MATGVPSKVIAKVFNSNGEKLDPLTSTKVETGPLLGVSVIVGAVTVKTVLAELELVSVALTVWGPSAALGTLNVALNPPLPLVVINAGTVETGAPSNLIVTATEDPKFEPVTVTVVFLGPNSGETEIEVFALLVPCKQITSAGHWKMLPRPLNTWTVQVEGEQEFASTLVSK